jgi:hypothetical protein
MNFTPVMALACFAGAILPWKRALVASLVTMLISDLALGYSFSSMTVVIYACVGLTVGIGTLLARHRTPLRTLGGAVGGSVLFFLVTNFCCWAGPTMPAPFDYPKTLAGLLECYTMALPFFRNSLAGDVVWTFALFAAYDLARSPFWRRHRARCA